MTDSKRIRVLVVSLGRRGGVTEYGWLMGRALSEQADVAVVYSEYADNAWKWQELDCPKLSVRTFNTLPGLIASFLAAGRFLRVHRFARAFSPDLVYYPGGHAWKPVLDLLFPLSVRTVLTIHDPVLHEGEASPLWRAFEWLNRRRVSGYVLLNSAQGYAFLRSRRLEPGRVAVIPHGVFDDYGRGPQGLLDLTGIAHAAAQQAGRYMLFVGRFKPYKGLDLLLQAYASIPEDAVGPLVIAGSGELSSTELALLDSVMGRRVTLVNRWLADAEMAALVA
ncbi:glycosyltransferase, partial [bacterium]|nr:glycosyltransferase [bacterium]